MKLFHTIITLPSVLSGMDPPLSSSKGDANFKKPDMAGNRKQNAANMQQKYCCIFAASHYCDREVFEGGGTALQGSEPGITAISSGR
jgi:hypothetical protein